MPQRLDAPLPRDYYLTNFKEIIRTVCNRYGDLLSDYEQEFVARFYAASANIQKLYVRLISRKGPWFITEKLKYPELGNIAQAVEKSIQMGLMLVAGAQDIPQIVPFLTLGDLRQLASILDISILGSRKRDYVDALLHEDLYTSIFLTITSRYKVIAPAYTDVLDVLLLLFFGNTQQDMTEFVLRDLGLLRFEPYPIDPVSRRYSERSTIEQRLLLNQLQMDISMAMEQRDSAALEEVLAELTTTSWHERHIRYAHRCLNQIGYHYERCGEADRALAIYQMSKQPPSRERQARILDKNGNPEEALHLAKSIEWGAVDESERAFVRKFIPRIAKKLGEPIKVPPVISIPEQELLMSKPTETSIELAVLEEMPYRQGYYSENILWNGVFGLCFWDIVFHPLPGEFENPFQYGPIDLFSEEFVPKREPLIRNRLAELRAGEYTPVLLARFTDKHGTANHFVTWGGTMYEQLKIFLEVMDPPWIAAVMTHMLKDLRHYRAGFPDLFLVDNQGPHFWEVKGPGDMLRPVQLMWLELFQDIGIPSGILRVSWT